MPGPIVSSGELPWWLDPAKKSVTDPLYITLLRKAASITGLDNPEAAVMGIAAPMMAAESLPTDYASRMARAKEMGFTHDVYHGLQSENSKRLQGFKFFAGRHADAGIHVDPDPAVANVAASNAGLNPDGSWDLKPQYYPPHAKIIPLKAKMQKTLELPDMGMWKSPDFWQERLTRHNILPNAAQSSSPDFPVLRELYDAAKATGKNTYDHATNADWSDQFKNILKRHGYDSVKYKNTSEGSGGYSYMLLDPNQLRSPNALFDPARAKSGDLLASLAAAIGIGAAASHDREK